MSLKRFFRSRHTGCRQTEDSEIDACFMASVIVVQIDLHSDAGAGIDGSATLERDIRAAAMRGRMRDLDLGHEFARLQRSLVGVKDEVSDVDAALAAGPRASSPSLPWPAERAPNRQ